MNLENACYEVVEIACSNNVECLKLMTSHGYIPTIKQGSEVTNIKIDDRVIVPFPIAFRANSCSTEKNQTLVCA
ncbi:hypothetical protein [Nostoc sp. NIES-3756]|uniref:hypothetical protein n=1 Tax=Nostoc sp. NIES-3756 TaxID=1751286 RepID=UPI0011DFF7D2|nr:hypothetical protein [Nostoc sp. NIES-3756]